ncbi:hypothetical protein QWI29_12985 [Mycolicibacterium neoaurum]|uniref:ABC-three component system middle component 2 n=1 Tax=Mycolicibacterium neoaurum TaxID=1795 RepID=UPI0026730B11|nr:ABC-three component system middle component 2 [Mycolicibacterium neoaurum]MDO3400948.1 hypothetical protein [Mycolicibacterium neoaurum]
MSPEEASVRHPSTRPAPGPENDTTFRLAQLLLLLDSSGARKSGGLNLERLSYYDFLTANPLLMVTDEDDPDRNRLIMSGFDGRALSYASPSQRFTSRRERLQHDLARLASYGLVGVRVSGSVEYFITDFGSDLASKFSAIYARAYRTSAEIVIRRLSRLSDRRLREDARGWIAISAYSGRPEVMDLLFAVNSYAEAEVDPDTRDSPEERVTDELR